MSTLKTKCLIILLSTKMTMICDSTRWGPPHLGRLPLPNCSQGGALHPRVGQQRLQQPQLRPPDPAGHVWSGRPQRSRSGTCWRWIHSQQAAWRRQPFTNNGKITKCGNSDSGLNLDVAGLVGHPEREHDQHDQRERPGLCGELQPGL